jgi:ATP-dependent protease Clp ATPase subunit
VLITGPSGSGKTYIISALLSLLASNLNLPYSIASATSLSATGYKGGDCEGIILDYYHRNKRLGENRSVYDIIEKNCGGMGVDKYIEQRCEQLGIAVDISELKSTQIKAGSATGSSNVLDMGIVYIDEIDKLRTTSSNADVNTTQVQNGLLKIIEGSEIRIDGVTPPVQTRFGGGSSSSNGNGGGVVDTKNIMFVCSGAFSELNAEMRMVHGDGTISTKAVDMNESFLQHAKTEDYIQHGMIRELIGRIHIRSAFHGLAQEDLSDILRNTHVEEEKANCALFGLDLEVTDCAIEEMSRQAANDGTGARGLKGVLDRIIGPIKYDKGGAGEEGGEKVKIVVDEAACKIIDQ